MNSLERTFWGPDIIDFIFPHIWPNKLPTHIIKTVFPPRTGLGVTCCLTVVTIGFVGNIKPKVIICDIIVGLIWDIANCNALISISDETMHFLLKVSFPGLLWDGFGRLHHLLFCLCLPFSCRVCLYQLCWSVSEYVIVMVMAMITMMIIIIIMMIITIMMIMIINHGHDHECYWKQCCRYVLRVKYQDQDRALILQDMTFNMVGGEQNI